jgi:hypothetical protein
MMDMKRKVSRGIAVLAIALSAGHLVQNMGQKGQPAPKPATSAALATKPAKVAPVAAGPEAAKPGAATLAPAAAAPPLPETPLIEAAKSAPVAEPVKLAEPVAPTPPATPIPAAKPEQPALAETTPAQPAAAPAVAAAETPSAPSCDLALDLMEEPSAMIGVTLLAPCHPNQRVVLRHGGLAVTGQTTATGSLFTGLPALDSAATVEAFFADGARTTAKIAMPELASLRRFGVQWQADDAFQLHAFENGAAYGDPGHVSAADPYRPAAGLPAKGGFLTLVGDASTENPLLAEVYTYPVDPAAKPEIVVEASVTDKTCGRELIGETLTTIGGSTFVTDLSLAMPECDAIGDYLVLKNLVLDMNMAAAN